MPATVANESTASPVQQALSAETFISPPKPRAATPAPPQIEEEDDTDVPVAVGTKCKRNGCNVEFVSNEESRSGDAKSAVCAYHPSQVCYIPAAIVRSAHVFE